MKHATVVAKGKSCSESVSRYYRMTSTQFWEEGYVCRGKQGGKTKYIASSETHVAGVGGRSFTALLLPWNGDDIKTLFYFDFKYFVSSSTSYSPHYFPLLFLSWSPHYLNLLTSPPHSVLAISFLLVPLLLFILFLLFFIIFLLFLLLCFSSACHYPFHFPICFMLWFCFFNVRK